MNLFADLNQPACCSNSALTVAKALLKPRTPPTSEVPAQGIHAPPAVKPKKSPKRASKESGQLSRERQIQGN